MVEILNTVPVLEDESDKNRAPTACEPVSSLKNMCKQKRPEVGWIGYIL